MFDRDALLAVGANAVGFCRCCDDAEPTERALECDGITAKKFDAVNSSAGRDVSGEADDEKGIGKSRNAG